MTPVELACRAARSRSTTCGSCRWPTAASTARRIAGGWSSTAMRRARSSARSGGSTTRASRSGGCVLVDAYGGSDFRSIEADNTSAFNCRAGDRLDALVEARVRARDRRQPDREPVHLRRHDLAPRERARTSTARGVRPGMAVAGGALVRAFAARRLGLGRALVRQHAGLPALLLQRALAPTCPRRAGRARRPRASPAGP